MDSDSVVTWYICPVVAIGIAIWCFKGVFYRGPYRRFSAWLLDKLTLALDQGTKKQKKIMFGLVDDHRRKVNRKLRILEIGSGAAPNLKYYPADTELLCLEPNPFSNKYANKSMQSQDNIKSVEFVDGFSEEMPFESEMFDVVLCTLVLCTVSDVPKSLQEIRRVLKPGGMFLFLEHVVADSGTWTRLVQRVMRSLHKAIFDGCITDRDTEKMIRDSAMKDVHTERFRADFPFYVSPCIFGSCSK